MSSSTESDASPLSRLVRRVVPWVALIIVATLTWSFIGQYRRATDSGGGETTGSPEASQTVDTNAGAEDAEATGSASATGDTAAPGTSSTVYVLVLTDGLNLRSRPMTSAAVVKQLSKDARLTLLEKGSGWYRVVDSEGAEGWVAAGGSYTKLVEP